jgi:uncharacterized protein (TIGR00297 family)
MVVSRVTVGLILSGMIALLAWRRRSLSLSGALAAVGAGTIIYVGGGAVWFAALVTFFATSTVLGRVGAARKAAVKREFEKGDRRDAWQVLANGGVAAAAALGMLLVPDARWLYAFAGALACANGDTWATELGILSRGEPWSLTALARVPRGTSGAVSLLGLGATVAGALAVALVAAAAPAAAGMRARLVVIVVVAGVVGALVDSLLGATVQESFHCAQCNRDCESAVHFCGTSCARVRGLAGFGNDAVNFVATLAGALVAVAGSARVMGRW